MGVLIVIAKTFKQFSNNPNLLSYDKLLSLLHNDVHSSGLVGRNLIAGQGLDDMQINHAWYLGITRGLTKEFAHWRMSRKSHHANQELCHKHRPENILISAPERLPNGIYRAELLLHEGNELMQDHLTGQHVQGMVLTEACRQMFLAVTEGYCLETFSAARRYFVINVMNMRFLAFAFPVSTQICYRVIEQQHIKPDRISIHAEMDILQQEKIVASMEVKFTVFDQFYLNQREDKLAVEAVSNYVSQLQRELTSTPSNSLNYPIFERQY